MFNLLCSSLHNIIVYIIGQSDEERRTPLDNSKPRKMHLKKLLKNELAYIGNKNGRWKGRTKCKYRKALKYRLTMYERFLNAWYDYGLEPI